MNTSLDFLQKLESENIEYKVEFTPRIYREIIAFANTSGGTLYLGIDDNGNIVGLDDVDEELQKITNGLRDSVTPDISLCIKYTVHDDKIIAVEVAEETHKPYFLNSKGMTPQGVFVRQGTSSVHASNEAITQMIIQRQLMTFEEQRSLNQELTFSEAEKAFRDHDYELTPEKYSVLGITNPEKGWMTNLGLFLSDQNPYRIKCAVYKDLEKTEFALDEIFTGSLLKQVDDVLAYIHKNNDGRTIVDGSPKHKRISSFPEKAYRESVINAIIHRDYSINGDTLIDITKDVMEVKSNGGLPPGLNLEKMLNGFSIPRNRNLAEIFHRLEYIEVYGTGIRRIKKAYQPYGLTPDFKVMKDGFIVSLPNIVTALDQDEEINGLSPQAQRLYEYLQNHPSITLAEAADFLEVKTSRIYVIARQLTDLGIIGSTGRGSSKKFFLKNNS